MGVRAEFTELASDLTLTYSVIPTGGETITDASPLSTRLLGHDDAAALPGTTLSIATTTTPNIIYRAGGWLTKPAPPNLSPFTRYIKTDAWFFFHKVFGYESSSQLNAYFVWRCSLLEYTPGVGDIHTDYTWRSLWSSGSGWAQANTELGTTSASQDPYGGLGGGLGAKPFVVTTQRELKENDRILIEWGIRQTGNKTGTVYFEFGGPGDHPEDVSGSNPQSIAYGSECIIPVNFDEQWEDYWGQRDELIIPYGTDILMTNVNSTRAWLAADWSGTDVNGDPWSASRLVNRRGSGNNISQQMFAFHGENYLNITLNNIIDSCIQYSDHAYLFICGSNNWRAALIPDFDDWMFGIDINGSESQTTAPSTPYTEGGNTEYGPRIWRGAQGYSGGLRPDNATFPYGWIQGQFYAGATHGTPKGFRFDAYDANVATDAFTGVAGTVLPSYNANWVQYYYTSGTMQIGAAGLTATAPAAQTNPGGYRYNVVAGATDHAVEVDWIPTVLDTTWNGVMLKIDPVLDGTHYEVRFRSNAGTGNVELRRLNSGTPTTLESTNVSDITAGGIIRVRCLFTNGSLKVYFNSRKIIDFCDNANKLTNSGYCGIYLTSNNNSMDNFSYGTPTTFDAVYWEEGVDFRMASEAGGTTTPPDPNSNDVSTVPKSARTTFLIKKEKVYGWNGLYPLGFMLNNQCDVAGNGNMMFPGSIGNQLDKPHWNYPGYKYLYNENWTASGSTASGAPMDTRPIMSGHLHEERQQQFFFSGTL